MAESQVTVDQAREVVTNFAPNPDVIKDMPEADVMAWHGNIQKQLSTHAENALKNHDWRGAIAGDNAEVRKRLDRFTSPKALWESVDQTQQKLSKGEMKVLTPFPDKGSDEEKATWRGQNSVPADGKYELKLPDGVVIGENDKPIVEAYLKHAFEKNIPSREVNESVGWFLSEKVAREARAREAFEAQKRDTAAELGAEWGADYKPTHNKIQGVLDSTIPSGEDGDALKGLINNAVATNPMFARFLGQIALQLNPVGTMVPGGQESQTTSISDRIKQIEKMRREDPRAYQDPKISDRKTGEYVRLLEQYQKLSGKAWGA